MSSAKPGFTLIEIMVALAIAVIVIFATYTLFLTVRTGTADVYSRIRSKEQACNFLSMIRKEIEAAYYDPATTYTGLALEENDLYGKPASRLTFTTFFKDGVKIVSYAVEEGADGSLNLVKTVSDAVKGGKAVRIIMLPGIQGFKVRVLDKGYDKVFDAQRLKKLPRALKASLILKGGGGEEEFSQICYVMTAE